jgi:hypothetical protein
VTKGNKVSPHTLLKKINISNIITKIKNYGLKNVFLYPDYSRVTVKILRA